MSARFFNPSHMADMLLRRRHLQFRVLELIKVGSAFETLSFDPGAYTSLPHAPCSSLGHGQTLHLLCCPPSLHPLTPLYFSFSPKHFIYSTNSTKFKCLFRLRPNHSTFQAVPWLVLLSVCLWAKATRKCVGSSCIPFTVSAQCWFSMSRQHSAWGTAQSEGYGEAQLRFSFKVHFLQSVTNICANKDHGESRRMLSLLHSKPDTLCPGLFYISICI